MNIDFRKAAISDLAQIVKMLADDFLGQQREDLSAAINEKYVKAFREIEDSPNNELIVA